jgi:hypothetical protein
MKELPSENSPLKKGATPKAWGLSSRETKTLTLCSPLKINLTFSFSLLKPTPQTAAQLISLRGSDAISGWSYENIERTILTITDLNPQCKTRAERAFHQRALLRTLRAGRIDLVRLGRFRSLASSNVTRKCFSSGEQSCTSSRAS